MAEERPFENLLKFIKEIREEAPGRIKEAVDAWATQAAEAGQRNLARPSWFLSTAIGEKVKEYEGGYKVWAMAGFKFKDGAPNDPGTYGRYHEAGYYENRKPSAPPHFMRKAKKETTPRLIDAVEKAKAEIVEEARRRANT